MKKFKRLLILLFWGVNTSFSQSDSVNYGDNSEAGHFASVNGIHLYYEMYGTAKPLVLLHGNGGSIAKQKERIQYF